MPRKLKWEDFFVIPLFVMAVVLASVQIARLFGISFWLDETATSWISAKGAAGAMLHTRPYPNHPPYYVLIALWRQVFGPSEISLRLPSLLFSLHAVWLVFLISELIAPAVNRTRRLLLCLAAALLNPLWIIQSANARPYALGLWLITAALYQLLIYCRSGAIIRAWSAGFLTFIAYLTHPLFMTAGAVQFVLLILYCPRPRLARGLLSIILPAPLYIAAAFAAGDFQWVQRLPKSLTFQNMLLVEMRLKAEMLSLPSLACILFLAVLLISSKKAGPGLRTAVWFTAAWMFLPKALLGAGSWLLAQPLYMDKYVHFSRAGEILIIALLLENLLPARRAVLFLLTAALCVITFLRMPLFHQERWRETAAALTAILGEERGLVLVSSGHREAEDRLIDPDDRAGWVAPLSVYGLKANADLHPLERAANNEAVLTAIGKKEKICIVARDLRPEVQAHIGRLQEVLLTAGYSEQAKGRFGATSYECYWPR